jgi:hypothetical protein
VYTLSQSESTQFNFLWCLRMQPLWGATADSLESANAVMIILEITVMCVSTVLYLYSHHNFSEAGVKFLIDHRSSTL